MTQPVDLLVQISAMKTLQDLQISYELFYLNSK